ncbi:MAG: aspartate--tRNA ligase, partial [Deltaproteobacteria bacterium]|nr:aspartate--tRNA ligase [Deltaproteobacteria bacterium]
MEKRASEFSRKSLDELSGMVISEGAKGLVSAKVKDSGWQSSIDKFLDAQQKESINKRLNAGSGDLLLM